MVSCLKLIIIIIPQKIHELDTVTANLAIKDFIAIQNDTVAIEKKIEGNYKKAFSLVPIRFLY